MYPSRNPALCSVATAAISDTPAPRIAIWFCPMMEAQMRATHATARRGQKGATALTARGASLCSASPAAMGASTTCSVLISMAAASTSTIAPTSWEVSVGVSTTAATVEMVVSATDSATFARAM